MASGYGKKSLWQKFTEAAGRATRKVVGLSVLFGAAAAPVYYQYGTVQEQDVKVHSYVQNTKYNYETRRTEGSYLLKTDKGNFVIETSLPHLQDQDDVMNVWRPIYTGKTYHIKTYGFHIGGNWQPNILEAREVTADELKEREKVRAEALAKEGKPAQPPAATVTTAPAGTQQQPVVTTTQPVVVQQQQTFSGEVVTYPVVVGGYSVQLTIPVEAVGRITVNSVRPVVTAPVVNPPGS